MKHANFLFFATILASLFIENPSNAEDLGDVVDRSDLVAVLHITSGSLRPVEEINNGCGYVYEAFVGSGFKNAREGENLSFRTALPLTLSGTYLIFLTDNVREGSTEIFNGWLHIQSAECAESGVRLTTVEFLSTESSLNGPEVILERWKLPDRSDSTNSDSTEYFLGSTGLDALFQYTFPGGQTLPKPTLVEVQHPRGTLKRAAYNADVLLELLTELR